MTKPISLCEFLANQGGLRLFRGQRDTVGASDLLAMNAELWHRAVPFRKKLVRVDSGMCPDDAALAAWQAGYFGDGMDRPDVQALLDAVARELSGSLVYSADDQNAIFEAEMAELAGESREEFYAASGAPEVVLYEKSYVNRKGRPGVQYLAKVTQPGARKPLLHTVFRCQVERANAVSAFLAGECRA